MSEWHECVVSTTPQRLEAVLARLSALGFDSLKIDSEADFAQFLARRQPWEMVDEDFIERHRNANGVTLYLSDAAEVSRLRDGLHGLPDIDITVATVREEDWSDCWKQFYTPVNIGRRLRIQPAWQPPEDAEGRAVFYNDPGMSFGTGTHASTLLCLRRLEEGVRGGERVLDLGCGSGILFISALLLGAEAALGVDIDPLSCETAERNAVLNGVSGHRVECGDCISDRAFLCKLSAFRADLVCANLVADLLMALAPFWATLVAPGGRLLVSGILAERADAVAASVPFALTGRDQSDGWAALLFENR